jgi:hypothetical protein
VQSERERTNVLWGPFFWTIGVVFVAILSFVVVLVMRPANVRSAAAHSAEQREVPPLDEALDLKPLPERDIPL